MKVLVVDDEHLVRWFLERALTRAGYEVVTASGIKAALERLEAGTVDIIFVDLRMPEGNGMDLIRRARALSKAPKIVVCSAFVTEELEAEFKDKGICTLKKPFKLEDLYAMLEACIDGL